MMTKGDGKGTTKHGIDLKKRKLSRRVEVLRVTRKERNGTRQVVRKGTEEENTDR